CDEPPQRAVCAEEHKPGKLERDDKRNGIHEERQPDALGETVEAESEGHVVRDGEQEEVERDLSPEASVRHKSARDRPLWHVAPTRAVHVDVVEEDPEEREPDQRESE